MSRKEDEKKRSLSFLAGIADKAEAMPWLDKKPQSSLPPAPAAPRPKAKAAPPPPPAPRPESLEAERLRKRRMEERAAKLEEERTLRERRQRELQKGATLSWRGMDRSGVPTGIRRTAFDPEPSLAQKLDDVLGKPAEKDSRVKNREKGRRQGGK